MRINFAWVVIAGCFVVPSHAQTPPKLSANLHEIVNLKDFQGQFKFRSEHIQALRKNWFFTSSASWYFPFDVYGNNTYYYLPSLITTDNALSLLHVFFDSTLQIIEKEKLAPGAQKMSAAMLKVAIRDWQTAKGTSMEPAALKNVAYFSVADRLSGGNTTIPSSAKPLVTQTLSLVKAHTGFAVGPIFPYEVDYSQFVPRGHYTRTTALRRYFQTMMWFGLTPFSAPTSTSPSYEPIQQALLMAHELTQGDQLARWNRMYDVTSLLAGPSNHLTPLEAEACAKRVFGTKPSMGDWGNKQKLDAYIAELAKARPAMYVEDLHFKQSPSDVQVRFMGQRSNPDSYVLQSLSNLQRMYPSPLDVMTALGSTRAKAILDASPAQFNPKSWAEYVATRDKITKEFASYDTAHWRSDIYWGWLDCLRKELNAPEVPGQPCFNTPAWADRNLYAALASWAHMKHDTILYGQQSVVAEQGEDGDRAPNREKGYIEPNVELYQRMAQLLSQVSSELSKRGYMSKQLTTQYASLLETLSFFTSASKREIRGEFLTEKEYERIRSMEGELEDLYNTIQKSAFAYQTMTQEDGDPATVADFHTANDTVLEAGVGRCDDIFAVVKMKGKLYLTHGATLSFYEFQRPSSDRMTDHAWKQQLESGKPPARPGWIKSFFISTGVH